MGDCFRIFESNYVDLDILANSDVSSEQAAFPVTNAYNSNRRSKVWRSDGYYDVTSSNNTIIFRETGGGPDLTATIPVDTYTRDAFRTAVKDALELTGASTYTVTFNANFKFVIASNGAGGGGVFQLMFSNVSSTAEDLLGFDSVDYTGALTYTADSIRLHTSEWILWDLGIDANPQAFMLIDSRNSPLPISPTATVKVEGNHTNNFSSPVFSTTLTYDDRILHSIDDDGLAALDLRYWRVQFTDQSNPNGYIQVGAFYLGGYSAPTRGAVQFPFSTGHIDRTTTVYSEGGQTFSEIRPKTERFETQILGLTTAEKEEYERIFEKFGTGIPFFVSFDTDVAFSSEQAYYIRYVKFTDAPSFELVSPGHFTCRFSFEEQL